MFLWPAYLTRLFPKRKYIDTILFYAILPLGVKKLTAVLPSITLAYSFRKGALMNKNIIFAAFTINTQNLYNAKKAKNPNDPVQFFVAEIVGSWDWPYPFDTVYHAYHDPSKASFVNWNTARGQIGKLYKEAIPDIETTLKIKIKSFLANRKGHKVACYEILEKEDGEKK